MSEEVNQVESIVEDLIEDTSPSDAGALSFDEYDSMTDSRKEEDVIEELKKETSAQENKSQNEAESNDEEREASEEAAQEEIKKLIARYGDKEMEIAANSLFSHKVDGEEVDVELQELLNNYSGKISYDKKFQEFSNEKKDFQAYKDQYDTEIKQINGYINDFAQKFRQNDALGALEYFAEFAGMKPYEFKRELLNQLVPEMERRVNMTEDQIKAEELMMQNEYLMRQQESAQAQLREQQALQELENEIVNVQEAHGMSDDDFEQAYSELRDSDVYEGDINPASVAEFYIHREAYSKADAVLNHIDPALAQQDPVLESLQKVIVENPEFDDNDLIEIVQTVYSDFKNEASKTVSKKAPAPQKQQTMESRSHEEHVDWEDF